MQKKPFPNRFFKKANLKFYEATITNIVTDFGQHYQAAVNQVKDGEINVEEHTFTVDNITEGSVASIAKDVSEISSNAELIAWTTLDGEGRIFDLTNRRLKEASEADKLEITSSWNTNKLNSILEFDEDYFAIKDIARRVDAGLGSLGYNRYYVLIEGETTSNADDIILEVKAQGASAVEGLSSFNANEFEDHASRTITGVQALHNYHDRHWGALEANQQSYLVKERSPFKEEVKAVDFEDADDLAAFVKLSAQTVAYAHARAATAAGNEGFVDNVSTWMTEGFGQQLQNIALQYYAQTLEDNKSYRELFDANEIQ